MKDIIWLDWARVIGIFLVVFGHMLQHIPLWQENVIFDVWNWIYLFHMPLFFVISGYLYKQKGSNGLNKIFWVLVIPYLIYQIIYFPIRFWSLKSDESILFIISKQICGILLGDGYNTPISYYCCLPCWFIISIIQLRFLFNFIKINLLSSTILVIFSLAFLYIKKNTGLDLYACIDSTIMAIPYFLLGYWLRKSSENRIVNYLMGG